MSNEPQVNAFAQYAKSLPPMDFFGPTVDDDIRRAINRYGAQAVQEATKRLLAPKKGRPKIKDWRELQPIIEADAEVWIAGEDPFLKRSNYSIAKEFADKNPGHSHPATMRRIERKLKDPIVGRRWLTLATVWRRGEANLTFSTYLRTLKAMADLEPDFRWPDDLARAEGLLADYTAKHGEPDPEMTFADVEAGARAPINALLGLPNRTRGGLFGSSNIPTSLSPLLAKYVGFGDSQQ
jgi:hypothetical protein